MAPGKPKRPKMTGQCCGNCKWFGGASVTNHTPPRWRPGSAGYCSFVVPEVVLPLSITRHYSFPRSLSRSYMQPKDTGCPTWEACDE